VVSRWTGVPVSRMLEGEREKLMKMEERLAQRVIGQEKRCGGLRCGPPQSRGAGRSESADRLSSCFLGPTGVGKTELCKALAEFLVRR
jgi:ATP-dependent Clp protease ATP-binding subunit ClpB